MKSVIISFAVCAASFGALAAPLPTHPADDARFTWGQPPATLVWQAEAGADFYEAEVALDRQFTQTSGPFALGGTQYRLPISQSAWDPLSIEIFWRVRSVAGAAPGDWSRTMRFSKTRLWPPLVYEPFPDERLTAHDPLPVFAWNPTVIDEEWLDEDGDGQPDQDPTILYPSAYELQFAWDEAFAQPIDPPLAIGDGETNEFDLAILVPPSLWDPLIACLWWRIYGLDADGHRGPVGPARRLCKSTLPRPEWQEPPDRTVFRFDSQTPALSWQPVAGISRYDLQFVSDRDPTAIYGELPGWQGSQLDLAGFVSPAAWHDFGGTLYWRVSPIGAGGQIGPWTPVSSFTKQAFRRILCLGDSITGGWGSDHWEDYAELPWGFDLAGYPYFLRQLIEPAYPGAAVAEYWISGGQAWEGKESMPGAAEMFAPEYVIVMMGVVDIIDPAGCPEGCRTIHNLEGIAEAILDYQALPIISTLIPADPHGSYGHINPLIFDLNQEIIEAAARLQLPIADAYAAIYAAGQGDISALYYDSLHPNDAGYQAIADEYFRVLQELM